MASYTRYFDFIGSVGTQTTCMCSEVIDHTTELSARPLDLALPDTSLISVPLRMSLILYYFPE